MNITLEIQKRKRFIKECKSALWLFKRNEFCTESFIQLTVRLVMIALIYNEYDHELPSRANSLPGATHFPQSVTPLPQVQPLCP